MIWKYFLVDVHREIQQKYIYGPNIKLEKSTLAVPGVSNSPVNSDAL